MWLDDGVGDGIFGKLCLDGVVLTSGVCENSDSGVCEGSSGGMC